jgi:hypothetical protein
MRLNEVVGKVDTSNPDTMQTAYQSTKNLFSPSTWFKGKEKAVDPNLVQNGLNNVIGLVANGKKLLPADINNLKSITSQVQNGTMRPANHIDRKILLSALNAGLQGKALNAQQQRAMLDFEEQFD